MSGGSEEHVMGVMKDANGNLMSGYDSTSNSGFNGTLYDGSSITNGIDFPDSKYYDVYNYNKSHTNYSRRILGDATGEMGPFDYVSSWYNDNASFVYPLSPWFDRGGHYFNRSGAGAFFFDYYYGHAYRTISFRLVLCL